MATRQTDVVIVGAGAAGGIIAAELAKAGMQVIALERGPRLNTSDFAGQDELRFFQRQDTRPDVKRQPVTWRRNPSERATPLGSLAYGNQAGGGTVHYGAVSWRLHEDDFRARTNTIERYGADAIPEDSSLADWPLSYADLEPFYDRARTNTIERYGADAIPEDSSLADWPLSYADLEPFYDRAEYELGVSGKAGNLQGTRIEGGNVFEAPRQREYPLPPLLVEQPSLVFDEATRNLGYHPFSTPRAILSRPYNGRPGCTYCGFCQGFGCHMGAKSSILVTKLPEADATGNFELVTGAMVYRIESDEDRATGVSYWLPDGSENTIEADLVIVAPFIYDNTRLLLLSRTPRYPNGLANSSGHLGKHVMTHLMARLLVTFDDRHLNAYMGPSAQKHSIDDFNADNFDHDGLDFIRGSQISIGTHNLQGGPISVSTIAPPPGVPRWGAAYRDFIADAFTRYASMVAQTENLPYADQMIDLDPNVKDAWGLPAPRMTYDWRRPNEVARVEFMMQKMEEIGRTMGASRVWRSPLSPGSPGAHHEGGTRMGSDPANSVVNRYGQTWDIPNLFVVGSSTFPTMSGFNPTLTIQALAYMTADAIVNRYRSSPGPLV